MNLDVAPYQKLLLFHQQALGPCAHLHPICILILHHMGTITGNEDTFHIRGHHSSHCLHTTFFFSAYSIPVFCSQPVFATTQVPAIMTSHPIYLPFLKSTRTLQSPYVSCRNCFTSHSKIVSSLQARSSAQRPCADIRCVLSTGTPLASIIIAHSRLPSQFGPTAAAHRGFFHRCKPLLQSAQWPNLLRLPLSPHTSVSE